MDITTEVLRKFIGEFSENPSEGLKRFSQSIKLSKSRKTVLKSQTAHGFNEEYFQFRAISDELTRLAPDVAAIPPSHKDAWKSESEYDSWDSIATLLNHCNLSQGELLLLRSLAIFGCCPIPLPLVTTMSSFITQSSRHTHLSDKKLLGFKLLKKYPLPVVLHSSYTQDNTLTVHTEPKFVYVPQHLANHLLTCGVIDQLMAVTLAFRALKSLVHRESSSATMHNYLGLIALLEEKTGLLKEKQCFEEVYGLYLYIMLVTDSKNIGDTL